MAVKSRTGGEAVMMLKRKESRGTRGTVVQRGSVTYSLGPGAHTKRQNARMQAWYDDNYLRLWATTKKRNRWAQRIQMVEDENRHRAVAEVQREDPVELQGEQSRNSAVRARGIT